MTLMPQARRVFVTNVTPFMRGSQPEHQRLERGVVGVVTPLSDFVFRSFRGATDRDSHHFDGDHDGIGCES